MSGRQEHGPETVCYAGGPGEPYYQPQIICMCGWSSERQPNWQTAGEAFDEHLDDSDRGEVEEIRVALAKTPRTRAGKKRKGLR